MKLELRPILAFAQETFLALWFLSKIPTEHTTLSLKSVLAYLAALGGLLYLYLATELFTFWIRFLYRVLAYFILFYIMTHLKASAALFYAIFLTNIFTACHNIFSVPLIYEVMWNYKLALPGLASDLLSSAAQFVFTCSVLLIVYKTTPMERVKQPNYAEWSVLTLIGLCEIYIKHTLYYFQDKANQDVAMTTFTVLLQIVLLFFIVFFERYVETQDVGKELLLQDVTNQYRLESLEQRKQSDEAIRALNHDIKNHLRVMRTMLSEEDSGELGAYINTLLEDAESDTILVETGNSLLNGLLTDKARKAADNGIELDIQMDFSGIDFLGNWTLCTLFGNLMDNAIEACLAIPDSSKRRIRIRSSIVAGQLQITFANTYQGTLQLRDGLPLTTKRHSAEHGIGLRNVRSALKKYDGVMAIDTSEPGCFRCSVQFPVPEPAQTGGNN